MSKYWIIFGMLVITLIVGTTISTIAQVAPQITTYACADFSVYSDNTPFSSTFDLGGLEFTSLSGNGVFINDSGSGVGLQFENAGMNIAFPQPVTQLFVVAGTWGSSLDIRALDSMSSVIDSALLPPDNMFHYFSLTGSDITHLEMAGGGNEALIKLICVNYEHELVVEENCLDFENQRLGITYTARNQFSSPNMTVVFEAFMFANGRSYNSGVATIQDGIMADGSGKEININNITIRFRLNVPASRITLNFGEYGGNINLSINHDFHNIANFIDLDGMQVGGVQVSVSNGLGNDSGKLTFDGLVHEFTIGGQELAIDDICMISD